MYIYKKEKHFSKGGFSFIELVIVIAIVAIIASILLPTFSNIISKSQDIKIIENARIKYEMYISDNNDNDIPKNIIINDNDKCITFIDGKINDNILSLEEAKNFMKDNVHKYINFIEYEDDNNIILVRNMDNVITLKEVTNINELNTFSNIIIGYKDNNSNIYTFSYNAYINEYTYIQGITLEKDENFVLLNDDICTFTLTQNGTGWGLITVNKNLYKHI